MEVVGHIPIPDVDPSQQAVVHTSGILSTFIEKFGESLNLENPDHFLRLASIADLRTWERRVCEGGGLLTYNRYDIASLCLQDYLKRQGGSLLFPEQQNAFVEALFPRLYSNATREFPRIVSDLEQLIGVCSVQALTGELLCIREVTEKVIASRDEAISLNRQLYGDSFLDAFHNPLLGFCAPWYFDLISDKTPASVDEVKDLLSSRISGS